MLIYLKCDRRSGNHTAVYIFLDGYRSMVRVGGVIHRGSSSYISVS